MLVLVFEVIFEITLKIKTDFRYLFILKIARFLINDNWRNYIILPSLYIEEYYLSFKNKEI